MQTHTTTLIPPIARLGIPATLFGEPTLVGLKVELSPGRCCNTTIAELHAGKGPHGYELRRVSCGGHRGWLSKALTTWLHALIEKYGWPSRPIHVSQHEEDTMSRFVLKENCGNLFRNEDKSKETDRDYRGELNVEGREFWVSAWIKQGKRGKFMSLAIQAKDAARKPEQGAAKPIGDDLDDLVPF
jgi:hypothetical protein